MTILIVGDYATADDEWKKAPFSGRTGEEFAKLLAEVGIDIRECHLTQVLQQRPHANDISFHFNTAKRKSIERGLTHHRFGYYYDDAIAAGLDHLKDKISMTQPTLVIALGELGLWALTGESGITSWRGSLMDGLLPAGTVLPTFSPAQIMRMWDWRMLAKRDLQRAKAYVDSPSLYAYPSYHFTIRPTINQALDAIYYLLDLCSQAPTRISVDIETVARHISCIGLAWSPLKAICIPFLDEGAIDYFTPEEEEQIYEALKLLLTHPNCQVVGQNFAYDRQHFARWYGYQPNLQFDTMIAQHVLFPGLPKALDFISSMYCHFHRYWKDELKDYNKMPQDVHQYWTYNCKDAVITYEASWELERLIREANLINQFAFRMTMLEHTNTTMLRGVRIDQKRRGETAGALWEAIDKLEHIIHHVCGAPINVGSPKQMQEFFYGELGLVPILHKKTKRPTLDDDALTRIGQREPVLKPLLDLIAQKRSLGVFLSTFCLMPLDTDGRMRTSYNVAGTETFRLSSSENAFGSGGNLQNIPAGEED